MSKKLLLADDSVVIQKLVGLSFANEDVEIISTDNGDDAVARAREVRPDVVLADVVMPGKSGYEVCEAIKQDPALAHVPVLLLTGTFEAFDEARASAAGADGHITKPFEAQALVERVKTVIKNAARPEPPKPPPAQRAPIPADDLFADEEMPSPTPARARLFGRNESLDVTPALSEADLADSMRGDLFGPAGSVGSTSESEPPPVRVSPVAPTHRDEPLVADPFADDLGFDDPIEVADLPPAAFELDSAFDSTPTTGKLSFARDDAAAATFRSTSSAALVTDLDELLAAPVAPPRPTPAKASAGAQDTSDPFELQPEPPTRVALDLGPAEHASDEIDFGFDVSEQAPVARVDLLEESFSSLLDVSESQLIGEAAAAPAPASTTAPAMPSTSAPSAAPTPVMPPLADYDVSSSDLATAAPSLATPPPPTIGAATSAPINLATSATVSATPSPTAAAWTPPPLPPRAALAEQPEPEVEIDLFGDSYHGPLPEAVTHAPPAAADTLVRPPAPPPPPPAGTPMAAFTPVAGPSSPAASGMPTASDRAARDAVSDLSPLLEQRVQETLEKVAWEAFSDLSETIVKQVLERVERVAWEVIPQMAETLIREEIRKLKGEDA